MRRRRSRGIEVFSLSFLDVVSCGFGAIILLLVIVKIAEPVVIERLSLDLTGLLQGLKQERHRLDEESAVVKRDLTRRQRQVLAVKANLIRLRADLSEARAEYAAARNARDTQAIIERRLDSALQGLSEEMRRLLGTAHRRARTDATIGGIPVDSEYVVFIIDTSGSMQQNAWPLVLEKVGEVLQIYPRVKGIQVLNDMGDYMFSQYQGRWIPDTPARRRAIVQRLASWTPFSNSSPVEGIEAAIRRFFAADKRISLYVFGDDFSRGSIQQVVDTVERLNRADEGGRRRVRIHVIGFPVLFAQGDTPANVVRFAALMRKLAEDNGGSFVGLNNLRRTP